MIVIIDTNAAKNDNSLSKLLGNRAQLEKIAKSARLYIPEVVIDEIISQKRGNFRKEADMLSRSSLLRETCSSHIPVFADLSFEQYESILRSDRSIPFETIPLPCPDLIFNKLYTLALNHSAPFEDKSDKGFKDACISLSIDEWIKEKSELLNDEQLYFYTQDRRLASYFDGRDDITVIDSLNKLNYSTDQVNSRQGESKIEGPIETYNKTKENNEEIRGLVSSFVNSRSFLETHELIEKLQAVFDEITTEQAVQIFDAVMDNTQVTWILDDDDVASFIRTLFLKYEDDVPDDTYDFIIEKYGLTDHRETKRGHVLITQQDKDVFSSFIAAVNSGIGWLSSGAIVEYNCDVLLRGLNKLLSAHQFDDYLDDADSIMQVILSDGYNHVATTSKKIPIQPIRDFTNLLEKSSPRKREALITNLATKIEDMETDYPF